METRRGGMSDGEIIARLDALEDKVTVGMASLGTSLKTMDEHYTDRWHHVVFTDVYEADQRTQAAKDAHRQEISRLQGEAIADLQAQATRKDRDRRKMWSAIGVAIIAAAAAWLFSFARPQNTPPVVVCVTTSGQQQNCTPVN